MHPETGWQEEIDRLRQTIGMRWIVLAGLMVVALPVRLLAPTDVRPVVAIAMVVAVHNALALLYARSFKDRGGPLVWPGEPRLILNFQYALDTTALTLIVHLSGGVESGLLPVYLVYLPTVSLILSRRGTFLQITLALMLLGSVFWLEYTGRLAHTHLAEGPEPNLYAHAPYVARTLILYACFLYLSAYIARHVSRILRERRRKLVELRAFSESIIESIGQGVVVLDTRARVVRFNSFIREHYGWSDEELGRSIFEVRPDLREYGLDERFQEIIREGRSVEYRNLRRITRQGKLVYQNLKGYPLYREDEIVGAVVVVEDVTEQRQAQQQLRQRTAELAVLHQVALAGAEAEDADELLTRVTEILADSLYSENVGFLLLEEGGQILRPHRAYHGVTPKVRQWSIPLGQGISGSVAQTGEPLLIPDVRRDPRYLEASPTVRSELCVPLRVAGRVAGVINVESPYLEAFSEKDLRLVTTIAEHVGTALQKLYLFEETRRHNRELAARNAIARAVTRSLDLDDILKELSHEVRRLLSPDTFSVALYDAERGMIEVRLAVENGVRLPSLAVPLDQAGGLTGWIIRRRQSLLIHDLEAEAGRLPAEPRHVTWPARSWLGIPLIARDRVVGALSVQSFRPAAFTEADRSFLTAVADQAAVAIENARLYSQTQRRAVALATLDRIGRAISSTLQLDDLLETIYRQTSEVMDTASFYVALYEEQEAEIRFEFVVQEGRRQEKTRRGFESGLTECLISTRKPILIRRNFEEACRQLGIEPVGKPAKSWLGVPLIVGDKVIGAMAVQSYAVEEAYDEEHLELLTTIGTQAAIAIENARLYEETRRMAVTDGLTGLYNSRHFYHLLEQELLRSQRHGHTFSLIMFDLDDFKKYNDRYGHLAGDDLLRELADLVTSLIRGSDTAFRYGGEEFTLILPETSHSAALVLAERLRQAVQDHKFAIQGSSRVGQITISVGLATYPEDAEDVKGLVNAADMALLQAKRCKNRVCAYSTESTATTCLSASPPV